MLRFPRRLVVPLKRGKSKAVISHNISELSHAQTKAGKKRSNKQNVAIALAMSRKRKR